MSSQRRAGPQSLMTLLKKDSLKGFQQKSQNATVIHTACNALFQRFGLDQLHITGIKNGTLLLEASSAPWANRAKQLRLQLLSELRTQLPSLISIDIRVNPNLDTKPLVKKVTANTASQHEMSAQSAEHIKHLAESAPEGLKERLLRLAALAKD